MFCFLDFGDDYSSITNELRRFLLALPRSPSRVQSFHFGRAIVRFVDLCCLVCLTIFGENCSILNALVLLAVLSRKECRHPSTGRTCCLLCSPVSACLLQFTTSGFGIGPAFKASSALGIDSGHVPLLVCSGWWEPLGGQGGDTEAGLKPEAINIRAKSYCDFFALS